MWTHQPGSQRTRFSLSMEMDRLTQDGTAEPVSRDQILRRERGQGNIHFPCSADHVQDWQPKPVDPYSCYMCDNNTIHSIGGRKKATPEFFFFFLDVRLHISIYSVDAPTEVTQEEGHTGVFFLLHFPSAVPVLIFTAMVPFRRRP